MLPKRARFQFLFLEKFGSVFANMPRAKVVCRLDLRHAAVEEEKIP